MAEAADIFATPYLTPRDMERARRLQFAPRAQPVGMHVGQHASPQVGHAAEFNDYRPYTPGDHIADIDWKVLGRTDRLYIKRFEHQTDMTVTLLLDASASMAYDGGDAASCKFTAACRMLALLGVVLLQQHDRVVVGVSQDGLTESLREVRSMRELAALLGALHQLKPTGRADMPRAVMAGLQQATQRSVVVVLSDLIDDASSTLAPLIAHRARGGDAILVQVLHPHELALPFDRPVVVVDSETGNRVEIDGRVERRRYEQRMAAHVEQWRLASTRAGIDHVMTTSDRDAIDALRPYLAGRQVRRMTS